MDLYTYDPSVMAWSDLSNTMKGDIPSPRDSHGFAPANGKIYLFGGIYRKGMTVILLCACGHCIQYFDISNEFSEQLIFG